MPGIFSEFGTDAGQEIPQNFLQEHLSDTKISDATDMSGYEVPATFKELEVVFAKKNAPLPIKNIYRHDVKDLLVADGQVFITLKNMKM